MSIGLGFGDPWASRACSPQPCRPLSCRRPRAGTSRENRCSSIATEERERREGSRLRCVSGSWNFTSFLPACNASERPLGGRIRVTHAGVPLMRYKARALPRIGSTMRHDSSTASGVGLPAAQRRSRWLFSVAAEPDEPLRSRETRAYCSWRRRAPWCTRLPCPRTRRQTP